MDIWDSILRKMTTKQRPRVIAMLQKVAMGVLPLLGPAGTGKSTLMTLIMLLRIGTKEVTISVRTSVAATNIVSRLHEKDDYNRLLIRVWSSSLEKMQCCEMIMKTQMHRGVTNPVSLQVTNAGNTICPLSSGASNATTATPAADD